MTNQKQHLVALSSEYYPDGPFYHTLHQHLQSIFRTYESFHLQTKEISSVEIYPPKETPYHIILPLEHEKEPFCDLRILKKELQSKMQNYHLKILSTERETTAVFICISDSESNWNECLSSAPNPFIESAKRHNISFFISEAQSELCRLNETYADVKNLFFLPNLSHCIRILSLGSPLEYTPHTQYIKYSQ